MRTAQIAQTTRGSCVLCVTGSTAYSDALWPQNTYTSEASRARLPLYGMKRENMKSTASFESECKAENNNDIKVTVPAG